MLNIERDEPLQRGGARHRRVDDKAGDTLRLDAFLVPLSRVLGSMINYQLHRKVYPTITTHSQILQNGRCSQSSDYPGCFEVINSFLSILLVSLLTLASAIFNDPDSLQVKFPVPICQCVQIKALGTTGEGNPERYRLVLSDISNFVQSMLATRSSSPFHVFVAR